MIDFYTWTTPNGRKVSILLEELALDYTVHSINIGLGDQRTPEFLKISANNKIPAIIDNDTGVSLMESGAIIIKYSRLWVILNLHDNDLLALHHRCLW